MSSKGFFNILILVVMPIIINFSHGASSSRSNKSAEVQLGNQLSAEEEENRSEEMVAADRNPETTTATQTYVTRPNTGPMGLILSELPQLTLPTGNNAKLTTAQRCLEIAGIEKKISRLEEPIVRLLPPFLLLIEIAILGSISTSNILETTLPDWQHSDIWELVEDILLGMADLINKDLKLGCGTQLAIQYLDASLPKFFNTLKNISRISGDPYDAGPNDPIQNIISSMTVNLSLALKAIDQAIAARINGTSTKKTFFNGTNPTNLACELVKIRGLLTHFSCSGLAAAEAWTPEGEDDPRTSLLNNCVKSLTINLNTTLQALTGILV